MSTGLLEAALWHASKNTPVFPCVPRTKVPKTQNGFYDATTDPETIRGWWSENPDYNLAIPTGQASGIVVLDVDEPVVTDEWLAENGYTIPHTVTAKTGRGQHLYFSHPGYEVRTGNVPGGQVKGDGGYVMVPPSLHPAGVRYEWVDGMSPNEAEIAELPDWLLEELSKRPERSSSICPVEQTIPEGNRNSTLFSHARSLFRKGYGEDEVSALLDALNEGRCVPPLDADEVEEVVESAGSDKYERGEIHLSNGTGGFTANELMSMDLPPLRWVIPDLLPEGVTVLGGKPKIGKSWLALGLCVATATGGVALGTKRVEQGDALYLALEDNTRRLQERLGKILTEEAPHNFQIHLEWPRLNEGGAEQLEQWLQAHPNARLVVIDTLAKIRKPANGSNVYAEDYAALESLIPLAASNNVGIVVVHHVRKLAADDPLDELNASTGLSGSVDSALILKRSKGASDATLYVRGRDVEEKELAVRWDANISGFRVVGDAADFAMSDIRQKIKRVITDAGKPLGPKEVALVGHLDYEQTKKEMQRMADAGQLDKVGRGKYTVPSVPAVPVVPSVPSVPFSDDWDDGDSESNVVPFVVPVESA